MLGLFGKNFNAVLLEAQKKVQKADKEQVPPADALKYLDANLTGVDSGSVKENQRAAYYNCQLLRARVLHSTGRTEDALDQLQNTLQSARAVALLEFETPVTQQAHAYLSDALAKGKRGKGLIAQLRFWIDGDWSARRLDDGLALCRLGAEAYVNDADIHARLLDFLFAKDDPVGAMRAMTGALAADPALSHRLENYAHRALQTVTEAQDQKLRAAQGRGHLLAGQIAHHLGKITQAQLHLEAANQLLGKEFEQHAPLLLDVYFRLRQVDQFKALARDILASRPSQDTLISLITPALSLRESSPEDHSLLVLVGACYLMQGRVELAVEAFGEALKGGAELARDVDKWLAGLDAAATLNPDLALLRARVLAQTDRLPQSFALLQNLEKARINDKCASQILDILANRLLALQPQWKEARAYAARLHRRLKQFREMFSLLQTLLNQDRDAATVADMCISALDNREVGRDHLVANYLAARACLELNRNDEAVPLFARVIENESASQEVLHWIRKTLAALPAAGDSRDLQYVMGCLDERLGFADDAVRHFARALDDSTDPDAAREVLARLEPMCQDHDAQFKGALAAAKAYLRLARPEKAKPYILACARGGPEARATMFEFLFHPPADAAAPQMQPPLLIEACIESGDEAWYQRALQTAQDLWKNDNRHAQFLNHQCARLNSASQEPKTQYQANVLRVKVLLALHEVDKAARLALETLRKFPGERVNMLSVLENAAKKTDQPGAQNLLLALGKFYLESNKTNEALAAFKKACDHGDEHLRAEVISICFSLAEQDKEAVSALLTACAIAAVPDTNTDLCNKLMDALTARLEKLDGGQLKSAVGSAARFIELGASPWKCRLFSARACARTAAEVGNAIDHYGACLDEGSPADAQIVAADLAALTKSHSTNLDAIRLFSRASRIAGDAEAARAILVDHARQHNASAQACANDIKAVSHGDAEDVRAMAELLRLAGLPDAAAEAIRAKLAEPAACDALMQEASALCGAFPEHSGAALLLIGLQARVSPLDALDQVVDKIDAFAATAVPDRSEAPLRLLLADCDCLLDRVADAPLRARALAAKAHVLHRLKECETAAECLQTALQVAIDAADDVDKRARKWHKENQHYAYLVTRVLVCKSKRDLDGAAKIVKQLARNYPDRLAVAEQLAAEIAAETEPGGRGAVRALQRQLLIQMQRWDDYAALCRTSLEEAPAAYDKLKSELYSLLDGGAPSSPVYYFLAEAIERNEPEKLEEACAVLGRLIDAAFEDNAAGVLAQLDGLVERRPGELSPRIRKIEIMYRQGPTAYADLAETCDSLCREFGEEGAKNVLAFADAHPMQNLQDVPLLHAASRAHQALKDVPGAVAKLREIFALNFDREAPRLERAVGDLRALNPDDAHLLLFSADIAARKADNAAAADLYSKAGELAQDESLRDAVSARLAGLLAAAPENPAILCAYARNHWLRNDPEQASALYRLALNADTASSIEPNIEELCRQYDRVPLAALVLGEARLLQQDFARAAESLERVLGLGDLTENDAVDAHKHLGQCYAGLELYDKAIEHLAAACSLAPDDDAIAARFVSLHFDERWRRILDLESSLAGGPNAKAYYELGAALKDVGEHHAAVRNFQAAAGDHQWRPRAMLEVAKCHLALSQCNLAVTSFREVADVREFPELRKEALYGLGLAYRRLLLFPEAVAAFETLCAIDENYRDAATELKKATAAKLQPDAFHLADLSYSLVNAWKTLYGAHSPEPERREEIP